LDKESFKIDKKILAKSCEFFNFLEEKSKDLKLKDNLEQMEISDKAYMDIGNFKYMNAGNYVLEKAGIEFYEHISCNSKLKRYEEINLNANYLNDMASLSLSFKKCFDELELAKQEDYHAVV